VEPKPSEEELAKKEQEGKVKQRKEFVENVKKIMVDGKNITDLPATDLKGTDGAMKKYKKYGSSTEYESYKDGQDYGKYTLWELYSMKDVYDLKNTTEPKIQLIQSIVTYFDSLSEVEKNEQQKLTLNDLLKKLPIMTEGTTLVASETTPSQEDS